MPTRQRPGRTSGRGGGSKSTDTPKVTPLHPEPETENVTQVENQASDIWSAALELKIPFAAPMEFYYHNVAPLIRSFNYDWRLEELQVQVTSNGGYLTSYAVHIREPNGEQHMKYDTITVSSEFCDPAFTRFIADRAFMCSFLKICETAPEKATPAPEPVKPLKFGIDQAHNANISPAVAAESTAPTQVCNSMTVEYSAQRPPQLTLTTTNPEEILAEEDAILQLIGEFTRTCVNREALKIFWDNNENVLMFIRDADITMGKKIGTLFGDAQRRLGE